MRLSATGLGHRFEGTDFLFRNLSFHLAEGDLVALTGPSGSGKSTLMSILARWVTPAEGAIEITGGGHTSWVLQNPHGVARRPAIDHVELPLLARGLAPGQASRRAEELLSEFGLADQADRPFRALSGGEAQRLMLARAVASDPAMLLVDEPTAQLDQRTARSVNRVLGQLAGRRAIVVIATHDPDTRDACRRVVDLTAQAPS